LASNAGELSRLKRNPGDESESGVHIVRKQDDLLPIVTHPGDTNLFKD
jgi:hypothetical protein